MHKDQHNFDRIPRRVEFCWRVMQRSYRRANVLTHHVLGFLLKVTVLAYFIFCALFLTLRYAVLPNVDHYKSNIEKLASDAIGTSVSIAKIDASWNGLLPKLALSDVLIRDKGGRVALKLPQVSATLSWWSAVVGDLRLHSLELIRPELDIRRDPDGRLYVAGALIDVAKSGDGKGADWILSQREIVIRDGWVRWNDGLRSAPELSLSNVDFVLRNKWQVHQLAMKATPPASLAAPLDIRAHFRHPPFAGKISDITQWKGELYADVQETDMAAWKGYVDYPVDIAQGLSLIHI